jgi:hypothetical protein
MKRAPVSDILWLFLGTRLLLIVGTYLSFILFPVPPHVYPNTPVDLTGLLTAWNYWDAERFVHIAQYGYQNIYDTPFFPLLPLLIKGFALLLGNQFYLAAGMIISNAALLGTMFVLYQLAIEALGERVGKRTLLYLCIFPTAFFFFTAYNESLFLLLTCSTFLALRRQKWLLAGLLGLLAATTRTAGVMLVFPFLYEVWVSRALPVDREQQPGLFRQVLAVLPRGLPIILIPLGTISYCFFCWSAFGNPLVFATVQIHWARSTAFPWAGVVNALVELFHTQPFGSFSEAHILLDLTATLGAIALAIVSWRKLRPSYTLWIMLLVLFMLISPALTQADALQSNQRFILEMFPAFIVLAALGLKYPRLHYAFLLAFPFLQAIMAALFVLNRWMV